MMKPLRHPYPQECVFHKAVLDKKSPSVVSRLAKQAALMYAEVAALFNAQARGQRAAGRCVLAKAPCPNKRCGTRFLITKGPEEGPAAAPPQRSMPARGRLASATRLCAWFRPVPQVLQTHFEKSWVAHTQMKASLMEVQALVVRCGRAAFDGV